MVPGLLRSLRVLKWSRELLCSYHGARNSPHWPILQWFLYHMISIDQSQAARQLTCPWEANQVAFIFSSDYCWPIRTSKMCYCGAELCHMTKPDKSSRSQSNGYFFSCDYCRPIRTSSVPLFQELNFLCHMTKMVVQSKAAKCVTWPIWWSNQKLLITSLWSWPGRVSSFISMWNIVRLKKEKLSLYN